MKLTWLGHSCFAVEQDGYTIILDPYTGVPGHDDICTQAHAVLCSHGHFDHNAVGGVTLLGEKESPFTIRTVDVFHDEEFGTLRGENRIHILTAGGVTVAHLGDLGHRLTAEQLAAIGQVDGILIPVGGTYTVDAAGAKAVCEALRPKWVVPMHYRHADCGFPVLLEAEDFLRLWAAEQVHRLDGAVLDITADTAGVQLLKY
ncbi:MAG: hypothetical protein E7443_03660 [Ruminococcaceae bacterium]|nr:hypothetical protein [Oscillospiraceae bacterium]